MVYRGFDLEMSRLFAIFVKIKNGGLDVNGRGIYVKKRTDMMEVR